MAPQPSIQPPWLHSLLENKTSPPKLYAWTPSNLVIDTSRCTSHQQTRDDADRRIYLLGVGNLGRLYADAISKGPDPPPITLVVHRRELLSQWAAGDGIEITRLGVHTKNKNFDVEWWTTEPPTVGKVREVADGGTLRHLIISTKASAAMPEADRLRGYLDARSAVAFVQNGMSKLWPPHGTAYTSQRYSQDNTPSFLACVTTHGVLSEGPFKSVHTAPADASVGSVLVPEQPPPSVAYLKQKLTAAPYLDAEAVSTPDLWVLQLDKLIVNCVLNPLTALLRCKNGALFTEDSTTTAQVIDKLLHEASKILQALVHHESAAELISAATMHSSSADHAATQAAASLGPRGDVVAVRQALTERFAQPNLRELVWRVGIKVAKNTSSMLQDVRAGKKTEVRDFNGWLVDMAMFLGGGLDASSHQKLIDLVEDGAALDKEQLGTILLS